jgi:hypothetical protein
VSDTPYRVSERSWIYPLTHPESKGSLCVSQCVKCLGLCNQCAVNTYPL